LESILGFLGVENTMEGCPFSEKRWKPNFFL